LAKSLRKSGNASIHTSAYINPNLTKAEAKATTFGRRGDASAKHARTLLIATKAPGATRNTNKQYNHKQRKTLASGGGQTLNQCSADFISFYLPNPTSLVKSAAVQQLAAELDQLNIGVVIVTESWITEQHPDCFVNIPLDTFCIAKTAIKRKVAVSRFMFVITSAGKS
jgi:hypothetical protein